MFHTSGPVHLTCIDWRLTEHRVSIAASLVEGVYMLEKDRQENRQGTSRAQATAWWEFFNFQLFKELIDQSDFSIYGAVFENKKYHKTPLHQVNHHQQSYSAASQTQTAPRFVIAFRGTIIKLDTIIRDIHCVIKCSLNKLTRDPRYQNTSQTVQSMVSLASGLGGEGNVWLAGHSLGSAIALQVGKEMAEKGRYFETYLFNPPCISIPDEIRVLSSAWKGGLSLAARLIGRASPSQQQQKQHTHGHDNRGGFNGPLGNWMPYLFVNPNDPICADYIVYFKLLKAIGLGSTKRILSELMPKDGETSQLLPSALLIKNMFSGALDPITAHGIRQWWKSQPSWHSTPYQFR